MNDLNRAAAGNADEITQSVEKLLDARERAEASKRTKADLDVAVSRVTALEDSLKGAESTLERLQTAIEQAYAGATSDTPEEIAKIDRALEVTGDGAGDAVFAAKVAWIADSRKAVAEALVESKTTASDTELIEENKLLKAELDSIKADLRTNEINYLFAEVLEFTKEEVAKYLKDGLAKASDEDYNEWFEDKQIFAKKFIDFKKKDKKDGKDKKEDTEAGLLSPSQRETPIDDEGATLNTRNGSAPADMSRTPRSKLTADLDTMFEEVDEPNLAGAGAGEGDSNSPMGHLVASLLPSTNKDKEV